MNDERRTYQGLAPIIREVRGLIRPVLGKHGFANADVIENWPTIIGEELAKGSVPDKIVFDRNDRKNGVLHIRAAGGAFAMLLEHQKETIISRVNTFFGYPAIQKIKIIQGTLKLKKPTIKPVQKAVTQKQLDDLAMRASGIEDPVLRQQMIDVGIAMLKKGGK